MVQVTISILFGLDHAIYLYFSNFVQYWVYYLWWGFSMFFSKENPEFLKLSISESHLGTLSNTEQNI